MRAAWFSVWFVDMRSVGRVNHVLRRFVASGCSACRRAAPCPTKFRRGGLLLKRRSVYCIFSSRTKYPIKICTIHDAF